MSPAAWDGPVIEKDTLLSSPPDSIDVINGMTFKNGAKLQFGNGTGGLTLQFSGTQTIGGNGQIILNRGGLQAVDGGTLTIGPNIVVTSIYDGGSCFGPVVNQGTISAASSSLRLWQLTNEGNLEAVGWGTLFTTDLAGNLGNLSVRDTAVGDFDGVYAVNRDVSASTWGKLNLRGTATIGAAINLNDSAQLNLLGNWTNAGTINAGDSSTVNLGGTFTTDDIGVISRSASSTVSITGTLENAGKTLTLNAGTGSLQMCGGIIRGGTIATADSAQLRVTHDSYGLAGGTLDGIVLQGELTVVPKSPSASIALNVLNGLTLSEGRLAITASSYSAPYLTGVVFAGTSTLAGDGDVLFQTMNNAATGVLRSSGGQLTIEQGIKVRTDGASGMVGDPAAALLNRGTISAIGTEKSITIDGSTVRNEGVMEAKDGGTLLLRGQWVNVGTLRMNNGTINLGGTFKPSDIGTIERSNGNLRITGVVDNAGSTLRASAATGDLELAGATIKGGTIGEGADGAKLSIGSSGNTLDGVTLDTNLVVAPPVYTLVVKNGLTLANGHRIQLAAGSSYATLEFAGTQTLGGQGEIVFENLQAWGHNQMKATSGTLTIGPGVTVRTSSSGGGELGNPDLPLINQGTISAGDNKWLGVFASDFQNQGTLEAKSGGILQLRLNGPWSNTGTLKVDGGTLELGGSFVTSSLQGIDRNGGTIRIIGTLDNNGSDLALSTSTGPICLSVGKIVGGSISSADGTAFIADGGAALEGVTLNADLNAASNADLALREWKHDAEQASHLHGREWARATRGRPFS